MTADAQPAANGHAQLLTAADLADRWRVEKAAIYRLSREGKIPTVNLGRYRRFRLAAVEEFEASGGCSG
ncbi:MAG TPA: helix-turn-helix domain-containing protein [Solirubrobacterales bacterium]|jgi:excisionase family DNA binding protein|nr:helix-turn-helix domain-containing protein [Solirubrobacterales bacterium]